MLAMLVDSWEAEKDWCFGRMRFLHDVHSLEMRDRDHNPMWMVIFPLNFCGGIPVIVVRSTGFSRNPELFRLKAVLQTFTNSVARL